MSPTVRRGAVIVFVAAALIATLYRYWLLAPVLRHVSIGRWQLLAVVVAAACGGVFALLRLPVIAMACASIIGLLIGGTWAAFRGQTDVRMTIGDAFLAHLEPLWRTVLLLTVVATVSGFCSSITMQRGETPLSITRRAKQRVEEKTGSLRSE